MPVRRRRTTSVKRGSESQPGAFISIVHLTYRDIGNRKPWPTSGTGISKRTGRLFAIDFPFGGKAKGATVTSTFDR